MGDVADHEHQRIGSLGARLERCAVHVDSVDLDARRGGLAIVRVETSEASDDEHAERALRRDRAARADCSEERRPAHDGILAVKLA